MSDLRSEFAFEAAQDEALENKVQRMIEFVEMYTYVEIRADIEKWEACPVDDAETLDSWGLFVGYMGHLDSDKAIKAWLEYRDASDLRLTFLKTDTTHSWFYGKNKSKDVVVQIKHNSETAFHYFIQASELEIELAFDGIVIWQEGVIECQVGIENPEGIKEYEESLIKSLAI